MNNEKLNNIIRKARPNLKDNSIKIYISNLNKLMKLFETDNLEFLKDEKKVLEKLNNLSNNSIRNYLNAILIYLMAIDKDDKFKKEIKFYGDMRDDLNKKYEDEQASGIISDKQKNNLVDIKEVYEMIEKIGKEIKDKKIKNKDEITPKQKQLLMIYTILNIYVRLPLRNDVAGGMEAINKRTYNKLTDEQKKENNYLLVEKSGMKLILNKYKTSKNYEENIIDVPKDLEKLIRTYIKINGMGVLFKTSTGKPLTRNELSQLLLRTSKKYMNKNISTTMLRKIYLSSKYSDVLDDMKEDAKIMGHSTATAQNVYIKKKDDSLEKPE
jgi:integrase